MSRNQRRNHNTQPECDRDSNRNENQHDIRLGNPIIRECFQTEDETQCEGHIDEIKWKENMRILA